MVRRLAPAWVRVPGGRWNRPIGLASLALGLGGHRTYRRRPTSRRPLDISVAISGVDGPSASRLRAGVYRGQPILVAMSWAVVLLACALSSRACPTRFALSRRPLRRCSLFSDVVLGARRAVLVALGAAPRLDGGTLGPSDRAFDDELWRILVSVERIHHADVEGRGSIDARRVLIVTRWCGSGP